MNKLRKYILATLAVLLTATAVAQDNIIDEVVWVVGDEPILKSEVEEQRLAAELNGMQLDGNPYCVIPEELAIQKLFLHQALIDSIEVSDADVLAELDNIRQNYLLNAIGQNTQTIITSVDTLHFDDEYLKDVEIFKISEGRLV